MNPGLILTKAEVGQRLNIDLKTVGDLFALIRQSPSIAFQVTEMMGEELLVLESEYVDELVNVMKALRDTT